VEEDVSVAYRLISKDCSVIMDDYKHSEMLHDQNLAISRKCHPH